MNNREQGLEWYRQPLVWLLICIPASAVVAGIYTFYLAVVSFDGMVVDDYYKHGKEINRVLKRDQAAQTLGLSAKATLDDALSRTKIYLQHKADFSLPERLQLRFLHTTRAGFDQELALIHQGKGYYLGVLPELKPGSWHILLETEQWRLSGLLPDIKHKHIELNPAV